MKKTIMMIMLVGLVACVVILTGCSNKEPLEGTWVGTYEDGEATWVFDGEGGCTLTNIFREDQPGTYVIDGETVEIQIHDWDSPIIYKFKVDGDKLTLTADNPYSPNYELTRQK